MESTRQISQSGHLDAAYTALDNAEDAQSTLKSRANQGIDKAIANLNTQVSHWRSSHPELLKTDIKKANRQIKKLESLQESVAKADLSDVKSVKKMEKKIVAVVKKSEKATGISVGKNTISQVKECATTFTKNIKEAQHHLKVVQKEVNKDSSGPLSRAVRRIANFVGIARNPGSIDGLLKLANKLKPLVNPLPEVKNQSVQEEKAAVPVAPKKLYELSHSDQTKAILDASMKSSELINEDCDAFLGADVDLPKLDQSIDRAEKHLSNLRSGEFNWHTGDMQQHVEHLQILRRVVSEGRSTEHLAHAMRHVAAEVKLKADARIDEYLSAENFLKVPYSLRDKANAKMSRENFALINDSYEKMRNGTFTLETINQSLEQATKMYESVRDRSYNWHLAEASGHMSSLEALKRAYERSEKDPDYDLDGAVSGILYHMESVVLRDAQLKVDALR